MMKNKKQSLDDVFKEINNLDKFDYENDPDFVTEYIKGTFVENVLKEMENKNINRMDLSKRLKKSRQYISRILNEKINFTIESMVKISLALGCSLQVSLKNNTDEQYKYVDDSLPVSPIKIIRFPGKDFTADESNFITDRKTIKGIKNEQECYSAS